MIKRIDFEKILFNPHRLVEYLDTGRTFPLHTIVSLTNYCNHRCVWCTAYEYQQQNAISINIDRLIDVLDNAYKHGLKAVTYIGNGEPTVHKNFVKIIKEVKKIGVEQGLFTNGFLLEDIADDIIENFIWLRISLDADSEEMHEKLHGIKKHYDKIIKGIEGIIKRRKNKKPNIGVQFAFHQANIHELYSSAKHMKELGVDYFAIKPVFNRGAVGILSERNILKFDDVNKIAQDIQHDFNSFDFEIYFKPYQIKSIEAQKQILNYKKCVSGYFSPSIWEDGKVTVCAPHKVKIGNIYDKLLSEIYAMESTFNTIEKLDLSRCPIGCRYHKLNNLLYEIKNPNIDLHINFI